MGEGERESSKNVDATMREVQTLVTDKREYNEEDILKAGWRGR